MHVGIIIIYFTAATTVRQYRKDPCRTTEKSMIIHINIDKVIILTILCRMNGEIIQEWTYDKEGYVSCV